VAAEAEVSVEFLRWCGLAEAVSAVDLAAEAFLAGGSSGW
jgi:hypothetical protein